MKRRFGASDGVHLDANDSVQANRRAFTRGCSFNKGQQRANKNPSYGRSHYYDPNFLTISEVHHAANVFIPTPVTIDAVVKVSEAYGKPIFKLNVGSGG